MEIIKKLLYLDLGLPINAEFSSDFSVYESSKRLSDNVYSSLFNVPPIGESCIFGKISKEKIILSRYRPVNWSFIRPIFFGKLIESNNGVILAGKFDYGKFHKFLYKIFPYWFLICICSLLVSFSYNTPDIFDVSMLLLTCPIVFYLNVLYMKRYFRKDIKWISDKITDVLKRDSAFISEYDK